ncbi:FT-interacting protein 7 [Abrus precatorius]|uniref:FT-interacting protein 7 n=1 Tax=Abrus precatorius TaxID=3816 RepID=A0A8B8LPI9_ABRPR|nr:FT-interacting protein 7 [Abrus precatorius]
MNKLVVEVLNASDLTPKDGEGSSSPFVEIEFDGQKHRTQTKHKDLNPFWNDKFVFNINDPRDLPHKTIEVVVYNNNDRKGSNHKNFLGRVRIAGVSIPLSESEADVERYPLERRFLFSNIKGVIALRFYAVYDHTVPPPQPQPQPQPQPPPQAEAVEPEAEPYEETPLQEIDTNMIDEESVVGDGEKKKKKKKEKEVRTFHSIPAATKAPPQPNVAQRVDSAKAGPPNVMLMQMPKQNPEYALVETSPPLAARLRYRGRGGDKISTTYDLVEQMHYLYVNVVKARDLPVMDISGSLDPYAEVKLGNYKGVTKHLEKNQNPVWKQIFAFSKERLQSNLLEVTVKDKDIGKDDFVGRVTFDLTEVPLRVPPDSPLAPQWYRLEDKKGLKVNNGEIMLAVWMGTQADESFPEAWHSDAHNVSHSNLSNTRSKVYFSPKLYYVRVQVIEAQDLVPSDKGRAPDAIVRVQLGNQIRFTRPSQMRTTNPIWNDELMFVAAEPFEDFIIVTVEDRAQCSWRGRNREEEGEILEQDSPASVSGGRVSRTG